MTPQDLRLLLRGISAAWRTVNAAAGGWIMPEFVVREGIDCIAQPLPKGFVQDVPKYCFGNTRRLVRRRKRLRYCEGYAVTPKVGFPIHHAWAIDETYRVIDVTLRDPEQNAYVGVPFSADDVKAWSTKGSQSLFLDHVERIAWERMCARCPDLRTMWVEETREVG